MRNFDVMFTHMHNTDDLIGSAEASRLFVPAIDRATFNRWAAAREIEPALALPGRTGARLFRRADVASLAERKGFTLAQPEPKAESA